MRKRTVAIQRRTDTTPPTGAFTLCGLKVLIVDDEPETLEVLSLLLEQLGATPRVAASVEEAMQLFTAERPDVIISDLSMPGRDGCQLIRMVRVRPLRDGGATPAIALSGRTQPEDRVRALLAGFQHHLAKPASAVDLVVAIRTALAAVPS